MSGYEADGFDERQLIEECMKTHVASRWGRVCSATAGSEHGACVPPYFVFQARVDGSTLDR